MIGVVVAIDEVTCRVRVEFSDRDGLVSDWLPVGQRKTLGDVDYWLPDEGTQVVCQMDERLEAGVVICAIYSDADPPPIADKDRFYRRFKDGSIIQYDRAGHKLTVDIKGEVQLITTGNVDAAIGGTLTAVVTGETTITTPKMTVNGNVQINGTLDTTGNITSVQNVSDAAGTKTMAGMREVYGTHTHKDNSHGVNTDAPNQGM